MFDTIGGPDDERFADLRILVPVIKPPAVNA
jgi:hypothetical protein